ncbi:MAG: SDR family NAD(P)-dependent oxidoreductase, partial [Mesorhizobium sp.]
MNRIDLDGQHAVVTGGAQGLGFAMARRFVASGATVTLWDLDEARLETAKKELGSAATTETVDVADWASVDAARARTEELAGKISILVNSAGIAGPAAPLDVYDIETWKKVIDVNVNGTFYVNRAVVPGMKERNYG